MPSFSNNCSWLITTFSVVFILAYINTPVEARDPKGTPLDELLRKQNTICKAVNTSLINQARLGWSNCIDTFILRPNEDIDEFEELRQYYSFFCRDEQRFKACWKNVTILLNTCEPGRGDVSKLIYFAIFDLTCRNNGSDTSTNIIKSLEHGDLCELNYLTPTCNSTRNEWYSIDICRRYQAQKICEQAAISSCSNQVHKQILEKNLDEIGNTLKCIISQKPLVSKKSSASNDYRLTNIYILYSIAVCIQHFLATS